MCTDASTLSHILSVQVLPIATAAVKSGDWAVALQSMLVDVRYAQDCSLLIVGVQLHLATCTTSDICMMCHIMVATLQHCRPVGELQTAAAIQACSALLVRTPKHIQMQAHYTIRNGPRYFHATA